MNLGYLATKAPVEVQTRRQIPTLESIAFQKNDRFGPDLEAVMIKYQELVKQGTPARIIEADKDLKDEFSKIVKDRLGLTVYLITNSWLAATYPNAYVRHNAVLTTGAREYTDIDPSASGITSLLAKPDKFVMGTVNTEKAKVTGWLSEQPVPIFMNFIQLMEEADYSSAELTGICLHELGHIFDAAAMATRTNTTNQILSDVVRHIVDKRRGADVEYVYRELKSLDPTLEKETIAGLLSGEATVMGVSAYRLIQGTIRSLSGSSVYDRTSSEAMADSFATRFGYGTALVTGLERSDSTAMRILSDVGIQLMLGLGVVMLIKLLILVAQLVAAGTLGKALLLFISAMYSYALKMILGFNQLRLSNDAYVYDKGIDRYERVRKNLMETIKDPAVDKDTKTALLLQLKSLEDIIKNRIDVPEIVQKLVSSIFASDRRASTSVAAQKQMETLIANDLFMAAAKLSAKA